jgi:nitroreductase
MDEKTAVSSVALADLIAHRWSPRAFDRARPLAREQILALVEAARWAPSCYGDEPWRYLIWERQRDEGSWQRAFGCLGESNRKWVVNAPVLMASVASGAFDHDGKPNRWAQHDTGAASMSIALEAVALGLVVHQMGGFDADQLRREFAIPQSYTPMAMIAIGYQADADILEGDYRARELAPRRRKPIETRFFEGTWEEGFKP